MSVLHLSALSAFCVSIVLLVVVMMSSFSMSGMLDKACLFPGMTNEFHILSLLLCSIFTLHMPNVVIVVLLYIFNRVFLLLVATNCSFVALGNNVLYMCKHIMFPSLPVSTLYGTIILTRFGDVFRFTLITEHLLLKLIEFIFTKFI